MERPNPSPNVIRSEAAEPAAESPASDESLRSLVKDLVVSFQEKSVPDLQEIRERTTIRNIVDYREVDRVLDPGWAAAPEIVQFGNDPLADTLVFSHTNRPYEVVLKPDDVFVPTDDIEVYLLDRNNGTRHRLIRTLPTLDFALEHAVHKFTHKHFDPDAVYQMSMIGPDLDEPSAVGDTDLTAISFEDRD
ncbi:hypothetical protein EGH24_01440 [Halonotius terrestris]|uniref:Uncharacterized protein n=1 Tax=Halonotius terrestris TaxID=2487750 RepID=A0A8J8TCF8_9EURY|nr:hypothetical protein [Halonotius terrestris]TQQ83483.1 hypothetical protein EGH24_01440 [Halonotius terrestris]